jgi:uncharacterized protein YutE (UPF0331/DUF86 family)
LIEREILAVRLGRMRQALCKLRELAAKPLDAYVGSETDKALAEHYLRIALEAALDSGNHVIAAGSFRKPLALREIPLILAENGILSAELASKLSRAAGLRNRLVYRYAEIGRGSKPGNNPVSNHAFFFGGGGGPSPASAATRGLPLLGA